MTIKEFLKKCSKAYYEGNPIISDVVFDVLESKYGDDELGYNVSGDRVKHPYKMYSLQKYYIGEKPPHYASSVKTQKLDGSAISIVYAGGQLIQAATRGNGEEGEDITDKILAYRKIPNKFLGQTFIQVMGEMVAPATLPNARNYAAGALNLKTVDEFLTRQLTFVAYGVVPTMTSLYTADMEILDEAGFLTVTKLGMDNYFPTDGKVIRANSNLLYKRMGYTSKHPRGAYALKDRADVAIEETELLDVTWQLGKGGKVTPVATFSEVVIDDAKITRATLHNPGFIEEMGLHIGDTILVTRSGGIIPKVVGKL